MSLRKRDRETERKRGGREGEKGRETDSKTDRNIEELIERQTEKERDEARVQIIIFVLSRLLSCTSVTYQPSRVRGGSAGEKEKRKGQLIKLIRGREEKTAERR